MSNTPRWRDGFSKDQVIQRVRPEHTSEYLNNPHKGLATFQRFNGDPVSADLRWNDADGVLNWTDAPASLDNARYGPTRIAYCRWAWCLLEPEKGKFRFDIIDRALATAAARGQTLQLRTQPRVGHYSCPQWFWDTGARKVREGEREVSDDNDGLYLKHWCEHIRAIGERFDGHPNLEGFDIAYAGGCGETGGNATEESARVMAKAYLDAFQKTPLVAMLGTSGGKWAMKQDPKIGWRFDCFGDLSTDGLGLVPDGLRWNHMYDWLPKGLWEDDAQNAWKTAPVTFETCWTVPHWRNEGWDIDWIIDQGYKYHASVHMPKSVFIPEEWADKMRAFHQRLGYWFHLHQMVLPLEGKPGARLPIEVVIDNKGIAPIYRPYKLALRFSQGAEHHVVPFQADIRTWLPDITFFSESLTLPAGLKKGEAEVSCAIVNERNAPVVRLAIKAVDADGWHPLTSFDVV